LFCSRCGQTLSPGTTYCPTCGQQAALVNAGAAGFPPQTFTGVPRTAVAQKTSGMAIASLVLGVLWIYWLGSILALILGYLAKKEIRNSNDQLDGKGLATAGIVLGWVGISTMVLLIGIVIIAALVDKGQHKQAPNTTSHHATLFSPRREFAPERPLLNYLPTAPRLPS